MADSLTQAERSQLMAKVRSRGNRSTEQTVEETFRLSGLRGWIKHPRTIPGRPDFFFPRKQLAVFVDGCFWHACPKCGRIPKSRRRFWVQKINENKRRDIRVRRQLQKQGIATLTVREHTLKDERWFSRLKSKLERTPTRRPSHSRRSP
jgi:DNA mismatch endonuclease (patch repair protein)